jgi:hypothetical protein
MTYSHLRSSNNSRLGDAVTVRRFPFAIVNEFVLSGIFVKTPLQLKCLARQYEKVETPAQLSLVKGSLLATITHAQLENS